MIDEKGLELWSRLQSACWEVAFRQNESHPRQELPALRGKWGFMKANTQRLVFRSITPLFYPGNSEENITQKSFSPDCRGYVKFIFPLAWKQFNRH